jgi:hypothetical protein
MLFQSAYFDRDDVALHGFAKFFKENSDEVQISPSVGATFLQGLMR